VPDPRKVWVVATTEFGSAVRTKSFLIGLLLLPIIMGGSILLQVFVAKRVDTATRRVAVIDATKALEAPIRAAAEARNAVVAPAGKPATGPRFAFESMPDAPDSPETLLALSERIRNGQLDAFVVIPKNVTEMPTAAQAEPASWRYYSDNPNDQTLRSWLEMTLNEMVRSERYRAAGLDRALTERMGRPVGVENLGLYSRETTSLAGSSTGAIRAAEKVDPVRSFAVPAVLLFVMFFVIMTSAPQLLNSVIEEKMSRISEVLLGSITPFELMLGKLCGNVAVALLLALLYAGGGFAVAAYHGYADAISPGLLLALAGFLVLGVFLYGSLYTAVGAACSELKDAQSLMMPVLLLSMLPMFVWTAVLQNPASPLAVGMSLFPPASPFLMLMRLALRPAPPAWQVALSVVLTTATALLCVWAAGKIFRTGLLMQGKAPSFRELLRWVMAR
jgi:ABC-type Na+ efflux pump permease subunit